MLSELDRDAEEMPELSDGEEDGDDEEQWQCLEEEDDEAQVMVPCLFCDR